MKDYNCSASGGELFTPLSTIMAEEEISYDDGTEEDEALRLNSTVLPPRVLTIDKGFEIDDGSTFRGEGRNVEGGNQLSPNTNSSTTIKTNEIREISDKENDYIEGSYDVIPVKSTSHDYRQNVIAVDDDTQDDLLLSQTQSPITSQRCNSVMASVEKQKHIGPVKGSAYGQVDFGDVSILEETKDVRRMNRHYPHRRPMAQHKTHNRYHQYALNSSTAEIRQSNYFDTHTTIPKDHCYDTGQVPNKDRRRGVVSLKGLTNGYDEDGGDDASETFMQSNEFQYFKPFSNTRHHPTRFGVNDRIKHRTAPYARDVKRQYMYTAKTDSLGDASNDNTFKRDFIFGSGMARQMANYRDNYREPDVSKTDRRPKTPLHDPMEFHDSSASQVLNFLESESGDLGNENRLYRYKFAGRGRHLDPRYSTPGNSVLGSKMAPTPPEMLGPRTLHRTSSDTVSSFGNMGGNGVKKILFNNRRMGRRRGGTGVASRGIMNGVGRRSEVGDDYEYEDLNIDRRRETYDINNSVQYKLSGSEDFAYGENRVFNSRPPIEINQHDSSHQGLEININDKYSRQNDMIHDYNNKFFERNEENTPYDSGRQHAEAHRSRGWRSRGRIARTRVREYAVAESVIEPEGRMMPSKSVSIVEYWTQKAKNAQASGLMDFDTMVKLLMVIPKVGLEDMRLLDNAVDSRNYRRIESIILKHLDDCLHSKEVHLTPSLHIRDV